MEEYINQYTSIAEHYDKLTYDVLYEKWAEYIVKAEKKYKIPGNIVLELACGTGSLSRLLCAKGYDVISVDNSVDMLRVAQKKCESDKNPPLFLCQDMECLDLYGTVDMVVCCLDSVNYLTDLRDLKHAFSRVSLFLNHGGIFIFDIKTTAEFKRLSGSENAVSETNSFYFWQYNYDNKSKLCEHQIEMFIKENGAYNRMSETHLQRAYTVIQIENALCGAGLKTKGIFKELSFSKAVEEVGRLFFIAKKI